MTDSTNNSFEEQWQHAFDNAELTPPESVWERIELGLKPEHTLPSKPNFGNKPYYILGGIVVGVLGLFLWFNNVEEKSKVVEKEEVKIEKNIVQNRFNIPQKDFEVVAKDIKYKTNKVVEVVGGDTNHGAEIILFTETPIGETKENNEEIPVRTLTDSVEMIEPLTTKSIHAEIENPMINLPTDQTPYYVKPIPKPKKKSILKNVKISGSVGIY